MKTFLKVWLGVSLIAIGFGIGIIILAFASGASWKDIPTYSVNESYDNIENIDFNIPYGMVKIIEGETFSIDAENYLEDDIDSYESDGTWYIKSNGKSNFHIFGMNLSLRQMMNWDDNNSPKITITIPEGYTFEDFKLNLGAGDLEANTINAQTSDLSVGAGRLLVDELNILEESKYSVGTGEMILDKASTKDITVDCGVGKFEINGFIDGNGDITCGIGAIHLALDAEKKDYSYDVETDIGDVEIDGTEYHHYRDNNNDSDNESSNKLSLDCGIGNITVDFN